MSDIRFVLSEYRDRILSYSINVQTNRLETVNLYHACHDTDAVSIGDIFAAKVINVAANIHAAFIDYQKGCRGYLPTDMDYPPVLLNRSYDGRIKAGDELLVQLEKEAVRSKEPVFTTELSLSGKYCVITNSGTNKSVSRKCPKSIHKKLLEAIPTEIAYGVIIRTNAADLVSADKSLSVIEAECRQLSAQMDSILHEKTHRTCYSKIWQSAPAYITALRDARICYSRLVTDSPKLFEQLSGYAQAYAPEMMEHVILYTDEYPLNKLYSAETRIQELLSPKVWLKSGAYLVIEKTEAMYVIDVNSGKNISKKETGDYIFSINMEAAAEIMYQLRLRNLTGIILVDFINMKTADGNERLLQKLRQFAQQDKITTTIVDMTALGLVEITRQKNFKSLSEQFQEINHLWKNS